MDVVFSLLFHFRQVPELELNFPFKLFQQKQGFQVFFLRSNKQVLLAKFENLVLKMSKVVWYFVLVGCFSQLLDLFIGLLDHLQYLRLVIK